MKLSSVAEIVAGDAENAPVRSFRPNIRFISVGIGLFILGTVLGLAHTILRDLELFPDIYGKTIFMLFIMGGMICMGLALFFPSPRFIKRKMADGLSAKNEKRRISTARLPTLAEGDSDLFAIPAGLKEKERELSSVTEHTTKQLERN